MKSIKTIFKQSSKKVNKLESDALPSAPDSTQELNQVQLRVQNFNQPESSDSVVSRAPENQQVSNQLNQELITNNTAISQNTTNFNFHGGTGIHIGNSYFVNNPNAQSSRSREQGPNDGGASENPEKAVKKTKTVKLMMNTQEPLSDELLDSIAGKF